MNRFWFLLGCAVWLVAVFLLRRKYGKREAAARYDLDLLAAGTLLLLTLGFFWRTVTGDVFQPADGGDLVSFLFPTYRFAAAQLAKGVLPLWNPTLYGGAPFIADIQAGFLYPLNLALFLARPNFPYVAMQWLSIGHIFWAGMGTYVLLRVLRWHGRPVMRTAAVFGAIAFQFSDPLLIHFGNLNLIAALSWMPWVFAAFVLALDRNSIAWAAAAGLLFAVSVYAGHAQSSLYIALALTVYTLLRALCDGRTMLRRSPPDRSWKRQARLYAQSYIAPLLLVGVIVFLVAAPILLPAIELSGYTERSDFAYQETVAYSLAPAQAIGLLTPGFFGRGPALHWGLWERVELPYAGVAALLMAVAALSMASAGTRRQLWPWVGLSLIGLATSFGIYAIVHGWLTVLLPMFDQFRAPARATVLWTFSIGVMGAVGVDVVATNGLRVADKTARPQAFRSGLRAGAFVLTGVLLPLMYLALLLTQENETLFLRTSVASLALALAAAFWLLTWALVSGRDAGWFSARVFGLFMISLLYFDLAATGAYTDVSDQDPTAGFRHDQIVSFLESEPNGPFRVDTMTGIDALWQPDAAALYDLQDVGGIANPLSLQHWHDLLEATGGRSGRLYDMLNAAYVIVQDGTPLPSGKFQPALESVGGLSVFRNTSVMPRAWVVHEASNAETTDAALEAIQAPDFDPERSAIVVGEPLPNLSDDGTGDQVSVKEYGSNYVALDVVSGGDGLLVLSEVWYPGWRALVDGVVAPVLMVNGGLRAVTVPAGETMVELRFEPKPWRLGLGLAAVGLVLLLAWGVFGLTRRERR